MRHGVGSQNRGHQYAGSDSPHTVAWSRENSGERPHPVGQKQANELGCTTCRGTSTSGCRTAGTRLTRVRPVMGGRGSEGIVVVESCAAAPGRRPEVPPFG